MLKEARNPASVGLASASLSRCDQPVNKATIDPGDSFHNLDQRFTFGDLQNSLGPVVLSLYDDSSPAKLEDLQANDLCRNLKNQSIVSEAEKGQRRMDGCNTSTKKPVGSASANHIGLMQNRSNNTISSADIPKMNQIPIRMPTMSPMPIKNRNAGRDQNDMNIRSDYQMNLDAGVSVPYSSKKEADAFSSGHGIALKGAHTPKAEHPEASDICLKL